MSDQDVLQGYSGEVRALLERAGVEVGDEVEIQAGDEVYRGILMSRYELADPGYIVIKLSMLRPSPLAAKAIHESRLKLGIDSHNVLAIRQRQRLYLRLTQFNYRWIRFDFEVEGWQEGVCYSAEGYT